MHSQPSGLVLVFALCSAFAFRDSFGSLQLVHVCHDVYTLQKKKNENT